MNTKNIVKKMTIKERILQFIEYKGIAKTKFCKNVGISQNNFSGKSIQSEIGGEQITKILKVYPEINPNWLLLGEEPMLKPDVPDTIINNSNDKINDNIIEEASAKPSKESALLEAIRNFLSVIEQKNKEYDEMKEKYENSKEMIKELSTEISELKRS